MADTHHSDAARDTATVTAADLMQPSIVAARALRAAISGHDDKFAALAEALEDIEDEIAGLMAARDRAASKERGEDLAMPADQWALIRAGVSPVRVIRAFRGMSQTELSGRSRIARPEISAIEAGTRRGTVDTLKALAKALGAPLDVIAGD